MAYKQKHPYMAQIWHILKFYFRMRLKRMKEKMKRRR